MPSTQPITAIEPRSAPTRTKRRPGRWLLFGLFWLAIVAMGVWNGRYLWLHRPLPDLKTVNRLVARHQDKEAEAILRARLRQSPHEAQSRLLLARLLASRGLTAQAAEQLRAVPYWWPDKADCLFREGQAWLSIDRARDAERAWLAYLEDDPNHPTEKVAAGEVETELINLYGVEDRWPEARAIVWSSYNRVTSPAGKRELTLMALRTRIERVAPEDALPRLRRFVAADPGDMQARLALARVAQEGGKRDESDTALAACLKTWPDHPDVRRTQLEILAARGESPELTALVGHPPESYKSLALYWHLIGQRAFSEKRWDTAADAYRSALRINPSEPQDVYRLAMTEKQLGQTSHAQTLLKQHAAMEAASSALTRTVNVYLDATSSEPPPGTPSPSQAADKLAAICRTLRWDREAAAWARLAGAVATEAVTAEPAARDLGENRISKISAGARVE